MSFSAAYYDAIRKDPPASLKEVPTTFPTEPKQAEAKKRDEAMTISKILIVIGFLGEAWVWLAYFKTNVSRRLLSKVSFVTGSTVLFGLVGYLADLY